MGLGVNYKLTKELALRAEFESRKVKFGDDKESSTQPERWFAVSLLNLNSLLSHTLPVLPRCRVLPPRLSDQSSRGFLFSAIPVQDKI
jgi:hypothetical protein